LTIEWGGVHLVQKRSIGEIIADFINIVLLSIIGIVMVYPMLYQLFISLSEPAQLLRHRGILLKPLGFDLSGYKMVLKNGLILSGYRNTIFIIIVGVSINLFLTSCGAYFLSRKNVLFYKPIMIFILFTMYFSGGLVPRWLNVRDLGLYNSIWSLIIPVAINTFNMILLRSYFISIPESLVESVLIDGGGHMTILFRVFVPLSFPAMAVMVLYYGVGHWNSWFNAMIYLRDRNLWPLQLVLREILIVGSELDFKGVIDYQQFEEVIKAAAIIISTVPVLFVYPFLQKYFVSGLMLGSLKG